MPDGGPVNPGLGLGVATDEVGINLTGTVSKNGTTTLTGVGTAFTTQLSVGQVIRVPGTATEDRIVSAIASDTSLTVSVAFVNTASGQTAQRVVHYQYVKLVDGTADATTVAAFASGRVDVNIGGASAVPTVSNAETIADNAGFTDGTSKVFPGGYIFDETAGTGLTENDVGAGRMDSKRAPIAVLEDATTRGRRAIVTVEGASLSAGDTAHDGVDAGNPVKTGAKSSWPAIPTLVATADRTNNWSDLAGAQIVRKRPVTMYTAGYRLANATAAARLLATGALTANTNKQLATIYHAASATKRVQIKYVAVTLHSIGAVAGTIEMELVQLSATTAPATGNPAITPGKHDGADGAAEATCLALPTTAGSVVNADQPVGSPYLANLGISTPPSTLLPPPLPATTVLWDSRADGDGKDLILRATTAEGFAIIIRSNAASTTFSVATIIFTEE